MPGYRLLIGALAVVALAGAAHADITTGLIASYPMDGNANDVSGYGNNGSLVGGIVSTTDRFGAPDSAYEFNGIDTYILVPNSAILDSPTTAITQAAWIMLYGNSKVGSADFAPITMKSTSTGNAFMYRMFVAAPNGLGVSFNDWTIGQSTGSSFPATEWHHVASVYDGANVRFYRDGVLIDTLPLAVTMVSDTRDFTIGADFPGFFESFWGKLDDVRIYNRALSDSDIAELAGISTDVADSRSTVAFSITYGAPNPTTGQATVAYTLDSPLSIHLAVYDIAGRRVRTLCAGTMPSGRHLARWDGRIDSGAMAASGIYFFRLQAGDRSVTSRVVLAR